MIKLNKKIIQIFLAFCLGVVLSTLYWYQVNRQLTSNIDYGKFEVSNLEDQIKTLREEKQQSTQQSKTDRLANLPFVPAEDLSGENAYKLKCFKGEVDLKQFEWGDKIKKKLEGGESIETFCLNDQSLNLSLNFKNVVLIARKEEKVTMSPNQETFRLLLYDIKSDFISQIDSLVGNYLEGYCNEILGWTRGGFGNPGGIYYKCGGGDGAVASHIIYRADERGTNGIVEKCQSDKGSTICSTACKPNNTCTAGYFCNLEKNNCVKYCPVNHPKGDKTGILFDDVCGVGICKPFGPTRGCAI